MPEHLELLRVHLAKEFLRSPGCVGRPAGAARQGKAPGGVSNKTLLIGLSPGSQLTKYLSTLSGGKRVVGPRYDDLPFGCLSGRMAFLLQSSDVVQKK